MFKSISTSLRAFGQAAIAPSEQLVIKGGTDSQDSDIIIIDDVVNG